MELLGLVRADAKRRRSPAALRVAIVSCGDAAAPGVWATAEQALVAEVRTSPKAARRLVDAFARVAAAAGTAEARGRAARLRGSWLAYVGRNAESLAPYRDAARRLDGAARDGARLGIAGALLRLGRHDAARRECAAVRRDATKRKDALLAAAADLNEGVALHESGDPGRAAPLFVRARDAFTAAGRGALAATAAQNLARALAETDRFDEAESAYADAATALAKAGLANDAARARHNRALLLIATDRLGDADDALRAAEAAYRGAGDPLHAALARRDRGETLLRAGLVTESRHATTSAAATLRELAAPAEQARTALLAGRVALAAGDSRAAARVAKAATSAPRAERVELEGRALAADHPRRAAKLLRAAAAAFRKTSRSAAARCTAAAARCQLAAGDLPAARRAARDAERLAARLRVPSLRFAAATAAFLAGATRREKDAALARSMDALESVRAGLGPEAMDAALLRGRETWLAAAVRHELMGPGGAAAALAFLERWRARSLVDLMGGAGQSDATQGARIESLRRVVAALERRAAAAPETGFLRDAAAPARSERRLRRAETELLDAMAVRRAHDAPTPTLADIQRALAAGTVVVSLFADADGGTAFVVTRDSVEAIGGLAARDEIAALAAEMRFRFGSMTLGDDFARRHAARLARQADDVLGRIAARTLAPIATQIAAARRLVFIPHGAWHDVPFAALPWRGRPLVAHAEVASAPALAALAGPATPRADGPALVLAFEDEAAPGVRGEAEAVASLLGASATTGERATSDAVRACERPSVLHIAAHGRHRTDAPALSGVRLADGWLSAAEFAHLPLAGSLVVLSGCETGVSAVDAGDEVHGLVRGALAAGARDLVASLWRVGDAATADFMVRFHTRIAAGDDAAAALAAVQCEAAAAGHHPWTWAGFALHTRNGGT